jgi:Conserved hypothetical protein 95
MNRAREQAIRAGLAIVENCRAGEDAAGLLRPRTHRTDSVALQQSRLDVLVRSRMSRLPWRGQFAPELIEYLMDAVCRDCKTYLDPFCGSGTVLFEAVSRGCSASGGEVNPAAWHLASLASFAGAADDEKAAVLKRLKSLAASTALSHEGLFATEAEVPSILDSRFSILSARQPPTDCSHMSSRRSFCSACAMIQNSIQPQYREARLQFCRFSVSSRPQTRLQHAALRMRAERQSGLHPVPQTPS